MSFLRKILIALFCGLLPIHSYCQSNIIAERDSFGNAQCILLGKRLDKKIQLFRHNYPGVIDTTVHVISLKYIGSNLKDSIYDRLRKGLPVDSAYIDFPITFDSTFKKLNFHSCWISDLGVTAETHILKTSLVLINCRIEMLALDTIKWTSRGLYIENCSFNIISFIECIMQSVTMRGISISGQDENKYSNFSNCNFEYLTLAITDSRTALYFYSCNFLLRFQEWEEPSLPKDSIRYCSSKTPNCFFNRCTFSRSTQFQLDRFMYKFSSSIISDTFRLEWFGLNPNISNKINFNDLVLGDTLILGLRTNLPINKIILPLWLIQKSKIYYYHPYSYNTLPNEDRVFYQRINVHLESLKQYVREYQTGDDDLRLEVLSWIEYQRIQYRNEYLYSHLTFSNFLQLVWNKFLWLILNNGYHGTSRFLISSLITILIFSFVYLLKFKSSINTYIVEGEIKATQSLKAKRMMRSNEGYSLLQCLWLSTVVFINPRFPAKYFRFHKSFSGLLMLEWAIGTLFIILYIIYVAIYFPLVRSIVGI